MGKIKNWFVGAVLLWAAGSFSLLGTITLDITGQNPVDPPVYIEASSYGTGNSELLDYLESNFGIDTSTIVYKYETDGAAVSGVLQSSYTADYTAAAEPPPPYETLTLTYVDGQYANATYVVVKDGEAGAYLWDVAGHWDGTSVLTIINNFFTEGPGNGIQGISNVQIFGAAVPEPTTMIAGALLLLPFAASTLRIIRKKS